MLEGEEAAFDVDAGGIACEGTVARHDAMTGNDEHDTIVSHSCTDSPRRHATMSMARGEFTRYITVGHNLTKRYGEQ